MSRDYPERFARRYLGEQPIDKSVAEELLAAAAKNKGLLAKQGGLQTENMARMILADFRQGKIGRISLERPMPSI
jgi:ribosome biogenesis GTPase A